MAGAGAHNRHAGERFLRVSTVIHRLPFPEQQLLYDWSFTVAQIGFWLAVLAIPLNAASIGRTHVYGLLATAVAWWIYVGIFMSV